MIEPTLRKHLSQDLRRLITGRMTNDDFDEVYGDSYETSTDRAVSQIAGFGYSQYSSGLLFPIRLRGRHAVDKETRCTAARAVLFLRSGLKYEWPVTPDRECAAIFRALGIPIGFLLSVTCIPLAIYAPSVGGFAYLSILGPLLLIGALRVAFRLRHEVSEDQRLFDESGDFEVWPFLRREDFDEARRTCHMFAK
jgi:hypothetical protein